jgi:hypothetical protein
MKSTRTCLAGAALAALFGLGGCATPSTDGKAAADGKTVAAKKEEPQYSTGSRIPNRNASDRSVQSVTKDDWIRDDKSSVITNPARGM